MKKMMHWSMDGLFSLSPIILLTGLTILALFPRNENSTYPEQRHKNPGTGAEYKITREKGIRRNEYPVVLPVLLNRGPSPAHR